MDKFYVGPRTISEVFRNSYRASNLEARQRHVHMGTLRVPFFEEFVWLKARGRNYMFELSFMTFYNGGGVPKWRNGRRDGLKNHCPKGRVSSTLTFGTTLLATNSLAEIREFIAEGNSHLICKQRAERFTYETI